MIVKDETIKIMIVQLEFQYLYMITWRMELAINWKAKVSYCLRDGKGNKKLKPFLSCLSYCCAWGILTSQWPWTGIDPVSSFSSMQKLDIFKNLQLSYADVAQAVARILNWHLFRECKYARL